MQAADGFSLEGYAELLGALFRLGYVARDYLDATPEAPHLILRHDVDVDLDRALLMAESEVACGATASYFVHVRTEFYNVHSQSGTRVLRRIVDLGHRVGLHFDPTLYSTDRAGLRTAVHKEADALAAVVGRRVGTFSLHSPVPDLLDHAFVVPGLVNAYAPRFTRDFGYVSDSCGRWRYGHPLGHPAVRARTGLQLLTHPIWWMAPSAGDPFEKLEMLIAERGGRLRSELALKLRRMHQDRDAAAQPGEDG